MAVIEITAEMTSAEQRAAQNTNNAYLAQRIPIGTILAYAGAAAPAGALICDGQAVSRAAYAALFDAVGTTYGAGNGSTTFNVPNLKGRIPVGRDSGQAEFDTLGETGGDKTHTLTQAQLPNVNLKIGADGYGVRTGAGQSFADSHSLGTVLGGSVREPAEVKLGSGESHNNLQPYVVINYIIIAG